VYDMNFGGVIPWCLAEPGINYTAQAADL